MGRCERSSKYIQGTGELVKAAQWVIYTLTCSQSSASYVVRPV